MNIIDGEVMESIKETMRETANVIEIAAKSADKHGRRAKVQVVFDIHHDRDEPDLLLVDAHIKTQRPTGVRKDEIVTTETACVHHWDTGEVQGQTRLGD